MTVSAMVSVLVNVFFPDADFRLAGGDLSTRQVFLRMSDGGVFRRPPPGRDEVDTEAVSTLANGVSTLSSP